MAVGVIGLSWRQISRRRSWDKIAGAGRDVEGNSWSRRNLGGGGIGTRWKHE